MIPTQALMLAECGCEFYPGSSSPLWAVLQEPAHSGTHLSLPGALAARPIATSNAERSLAKDEDREETEIEDVEIFSQDASSSSSRHSSDQHVYCSISQNS